MKISHISKIGNDGKFALFVDDKLSLIIDGQTILDKKLFVNQDISASDLAQIKKENKKNYYFNKAINYLSKRLKTESELKEYLKRKGAKDILINQIVNRMIELGLIDDQKYALSFIHDKLLLSNASKRKINYLLKSKKISNQIIEDSLKKEHINDQETLIKLIKLKKDKYPDRLKLIQYLVRSGFNYGDILKVIDQDKND